MPRRKRPSGFLTDPEFEFEFWLADRKQMVHGEMVHRMSNREFIRWHRWHSLRIQRENLQAKVEAGRRG